jgi:hypothetical protein
MLLNCKVPYKSEPTKVTKFYNTETEHTYPKCKYAFINEITAINKSCSLIAIAKKYSYSVTDTLEDVSSNRPTNGDQSK